MDEIWKDINIFNGDYKISDLGRVLSIKRIITYSDGRKYTIPETFLKSSVGKNGYLFIKIKDKLFYIHNLVVVSFIRPLEKGECINHIDSDKLNNKLNNLEITDKRGNMIHWLLKENKYKFSDEEIDFIRNQNISILDMQKQVYSLFNKTIARSTISAIKHKKLYNYR